MDEICNEFTCLYIHNASNKKDWRDNVFWYKAPLPPKNFKFGAHDYKLFHEERFNEDYEDVL